MSRRPSKTVARSAKQLKDERHRRRALNRRLKKRLNPKIRPLTPRVAAHIECHKVFDRLWCGPDAPMIRKCAYRYLAEITGRPKESAHIRMLDEEECQAVIEIIVADFPRLFKKSA